MILDPPGELADPFGTAELRAAVLAAWSGSPTRFREDANAEDDLLLGGYADRWLVELAQNAADAAQRAGRPGRLLVRVVGGAAGAELRVANTGVALDPDGVAALASLRASTKRDGAAVGRFGVGFAAVLGVSREPRIVSATGGVAFSADRTAALVAALPGAAAAELARRDGRVPVLRLCWPAGPVPPPTGYTSEVQLPLATGDDPAARLSEADAVAGDLLLALPWLTEIAVGPWSATGRAPSVHRRHEHPDGTVTLDPGRARWRLLRRSGPPSAPAGGAAREPAGRGVRPTRESGRAAEERGGWAVCWALPVDEHGRPRPHREDVLHAPTPSDERLALPARLFAELPLQPNRRRVRAGATTDAVLAEAARAYRELLAALPPADRLALVPRADFPRSELDATLRAGIAEQLAAAAWLPTARGGEVRPGEAVLLDPPGGPELTALLADAIPGLVDSALLTGSAEGSGAVRGMLSGLGAAVLSPAGLADRLAELHRPPPWWGRCYAALAPVVEGSPSARDELAALPVPLVDGRTVTGPRTVLRLIGVPDRVGRLLRELDLPGLRVVHPDAADPLLARLGATDAGPAELLDHPSVADAVTGSVDRAEDGLDVSGLAELVFALVAEVGPGTVRTGGGPGTGGASWTSGDPSTGGDPGPGGGRGWLAALALPDTGGELCRADELRLPDAVLAPLLVPDAPVGVLDPAVARAQPRAVLAAVGVLDSFAVLRDDAPVDADHDLDDEDRWWDRATATTGRPPDRLVAVRDLDLVDERAWPAALAVLADDPDCRDAWRDPRGYTAWWLARHARLGGHRPRHWRLPSPGGGAPGPGGVAPAGPDGGFPGGGSGGGRGLAALFDPVPLDAELAHRIPVELLTAVGVRADLAVRDTADAAELLDRLADPDRRPDAATTWAAHAALAEAVLADRVDPAELDPPVRVRARDGTVCAAERAVLLDRSWLAAALPAGETVAGAVDAGGADALAELLDLPLASEVVRARVHDPHAGREVAWSDLPEVVAACAALALPVPAGTVRLHDRLLVRTPGTGDREPIRAEVPVWWERGRWHAGDPVRALLAARAAPPG